MFTVKPVEELQLLESRVPAEIDGEDFVEVRILFKERDAVLVAEVRDIRIRKSVAQGMDERRGQHNIADVFQAREEDALKLSCHKKRAWRGGDE